MDWPTRQPRRVGHRKKTKKNTTNDNNNDNDNDEDSSSEGSNTNSVPKAGLHVLSEFPKQFVLSSHQEDAILDLDRSLSDTDADWFEDTPRDPAELRRLARELESFADMDYMVPGHLEDLLRQEGVSDRVVDSTVAVEKVWHDRAAYLNHIYNIKRRKYLARPSLYSSLPPIKRAPNNRPKDPPTPEPPIPPPSHDVEGRREWRERRSRPWEVVDVGAGDQPEIIMPRPMTTRATAAAAVVKEKPKTVDLEDKIRRELDLFRTEVDRLRWDSERQLEVTSLPSDFVQPRLVVISSKVPRCHSMSKAIRKGDDSILYIVYDFNTCTFAELIKMMKTELERYSPSCKAKSALFMCQGAQGCLYMFHKIVLTPQKMKRVQYQQIKEFWKSLGELLSKKDHDETAVHLLGGQLNTPQGKALVFEIQKAILPNLATVRWVEEEGEGGREVLDLYFDHRKLLLWRSRHDSSSSMDYTDITRSWSSLADQADDDG